MFCKFDGGVVEWSGREQDKLSFERFGHKSREVG